jgi:hypothetical protein
MTEHDELLAMIEDQQEEIEGLKKKIDLLYKTAAEAIDYVGSHNCISRQIKALNNVDKVMNPPDTMAGSKYSGVNVPGGVKGRRKG